ncbi:IS3 family transposase [Aneurinibacillus soli]
MTQVITTRIHFYNHNRPQRNLKKLASIDYRRQLAA